MSVATPCPKTSRHHDQTPHTHPRFRPNVTPDHHMLSPGEPRLLECLAVVEHAVATRDRHTGPARDAHIDQALRDARMALDGATINQIVEARA